mmetsp:Transcript_11379/g.25961  ORF Transcript_11379/g.25961 Transcript_11379/m.25961 type:complete len:211 (-) Transcript_11379:136-768(-)|eukprot:757436-Hanusia_phi.AAC.8
MSSRLQVPHPLLHAAVGEEGNPRHRLLHGKFDVGDRGLGGGVKVHRAGKGDREGRGGLGPRPGQRPHPPVHVARRQESSLAHAPPQTRLVPQLLRHVHVLPGPHEPSRRLLHGQGAGEVEQRVLPCDRPVSRREVEEGMVEVRGVGRAPCSLQVHPPPGVAGEGARSRAMRPAEGTAPCLLLASSEGEDLHGTATFSRRSLLMAIRPRSS